MRRACAAIACAIAAACGALGDEAPLTDGEVWNEGVGYYEAGDVTNALRVMRPLLLSRTHGARAAEVVAKLEHERGNLEEAAAAAQIALRADPKGERANRNFTRAVDGLPQFREEKRVNAILKASQGKDPADMIHSATLEARALMSEAGTFRTNAPERAVALADSLSRRAEKLSDTWIPVRTTIAQSVTNEEQASTILAQIQQAEGKTKKAATEFGDLSVDAYGTMSEVEHDFTRFFKMTVMPPLALAEDEVAQSNAWQDVEAFNGRSWQSDALDFTRAFRSKFPMWAQSYEQQAQADTNMPPFTAEDQAKISALATELEKLQIECEKKSLPPSQEKALDIIRQMRELMPKPKNSGGGQNQQQNQQQDKQNKDKQDQQNKDQQQDQDKQQDQQDQDKQQEQQDGDQQNQDADDQKEEEQPEEPNSDDEKEKEAIEAILKKAQERNDEHEADKKARMRKFSLPPNERDW